MTNKNILRKNCFIARQNRLGTFPRPGRKSRENPVRIYGQWQQSKKELSHCGLGLIPWIKNPKQQNALKKLKNQLAQ